MLDVCGIRITVETTIYKCLAIELYKKSTMWLFQPTVFTSKRIKGSANTIWETFTETTSSGDGGPQKTSFTVTRLAKSPQIRLHTTTQTTSRCARTDVSKIQQVFRKGIGNIVGYWAGIKLKEGTNPAFKKSRSIEYA